MEKVFLAGFSPVTHTQHDRGTVDNDSIARRSVRGWVLYDWASSAFATTVMAGFFPIFFKQYWNADVDATVSTFRLGTANSIASLSVALMAPILGAIADAGGNRRRFLLVFAAIGIALTGALCAVPQTTWLVAAVVYVLAVIGFSGSNVFYDALLVSVAPPGQEDRISARGFAIGYLGGGILFAINVAMTTWPSAFGLTDASHAVRMSFVTVAVWWTVFSIPVITWVRERYVPAEDGHDVRTGFRDLIATIRHIGSLRPVFMFLLAYWLYIDGVHTIVRMAVDYGLSIGFKTNDLIAALLLVQFVGFPASLAFGRLAGRIGTRRAIFIGLLVYMVICGWGARMRETWEFYALAVAIGLVQGGVTSLSRSLYASLIPPDRAAQFFGFYNTVGRFSAVIGPILMGWVSVLTGSHRASMVSVMVLFVAGGWVLARVPLPVVRRARESSP